MGSLVTGNAGISWSKCFNKRSPVRFTGSVSKQIWGHSWFECGIHIVDVEMVRNSLTVMLFFNSRPLTSKRGGFIFQQCLSTDTSCNFEILGGFVGFLRNSDDYWQKFSLHPPAVVSQRLQISFKFCGNFILISQVIHASLCFEKELFGNLGIQLFTEWSIDSAMETMIGPIL